MSHLRIYSGVTNPMLYFLTKSPFRWNIFVSRSRRSGRIRAGYSTQTTRRISCHSFSRRDASTRAPLQFLRCTDRAPPCRDAPPRAGTPSATMELGATPAPSPFRIKSEKSRGASRRHCVTCRCGSVCGRQRRHDANSGRLCLCH